MILTPHLLLGAVIAVKIQNPFLAILLAFFSHYFLDFIPHIEYSIKNIIEKNWKKSLPDFLKLFLDFFFGIALILFFTNKAPIIFICSFFAILPDGMSFLNIIVKNKILKNHSELHQKKLHFLKHKKIPIFWRFLSQIMVIILSIFLLYY
jgi:hypothetical protein